MWDSQLESLFGEGPQSGLTRQGFAYIGVTFQGLIAIHTQALVGSISVDAPLATRKGSRAFVSIHASFSIILQVETRPAFTLMTQLKTEKLVES